MDIEQIEHKELAIEQEVLGICDLWKGNEFYILKVINENNKRLVDAILQVSKENETLTKAIKQLNKEKEELKMNNALETHFIFIDSTKNVLFNTVTPEQEEQVKHLLDLAAEQEKVLYIE